MKSSIRTQPTGNLTCTKHTGKNQCSSLRMLMFLPHSPQADSDHAFCDGVKTANIHKLLCYTFNSPIRPTIKESYPGLKAFGEKHLDKTNSQEGMLSMTHAAQS